MQQSVKGNNIISENLKVLVFSSNINTPIKVEQTKKELMELDNVYQVDIDLDDRDNVLRIECHPHFEAKLIDKKVSNLGFRSDRLI
ncbi:hypothetical protein LQ318_06335 [Aliifodinibius salicampi]|uniref:HMA domain-containing protein n=1 Tax=Fodinibius salicampi TaxID=1920655 RepID=A0ABT3PXK1_9BACT|nr:hypothetical protein [Fodinibius salicampi]MCW9712516.1 hypothetical protein [Fodinibius salicampi]